jgi:hypothetical protein
MLLWQFNWQAAPCGHWTCWQSLPLHCTTQLLPTWQSKLQLGPLQTNSHELPLPQAQAPFQHSALQVGLLPWQVALQLGDTQRNSQVLPCWQSQSPFQHSTLQTGLLPAHAALQLAPWQVMSQLAPLSQLQLPLKQAAVQLLSCSQVAGQFGPWQVIAQVHPLGHTQAPLLQLCSQHGPDAVQAEQPPWVQPPPTPTVALAVAPPLPAGALPPAWFPPLPAPVPPVPPFPPAVDDVSAALDDVVPPPPVAPRPLVLEAPPLADAVASCSGAKPSRGNTQVLKSKPARSHTFGCLRVKAPGNVMVVRPANLPRWHRAKHDRLARRFAGNRAQHHATLQALRLHRRAPGRRAKGWGGPCRG